jgi:hypothetical protein
MAKRKTTKGQTMIYKTQHKDGATQTPLYMKVNSGIPEGYSVPAP